MKIPRVKQSVVGCALGVGLFVGVQSNADVSLFEWGINKDGVITGGLDPLPPGSIFDTATGLGLIQLEFTGAGLHSAVVFVDHEFSESINTFFNELGEAIGTPSVTGVSEQTWEIDEPGFSGDPGDIFDNFLAGSPDKTVGKTDPDDVSMAMGFNFILQDGESAILSFVLSPSQPGSGFYLAHYDPDSDEAVYFTGTLRTFGTPVIPEANTVIGGGMLAALVGSCAWRMRRAAKLA